MYGDSLIPLLGHNNSAMANNTTTSHEQFVGWVAGPAQRGTLNLVWSCATTVFACTWSVIHLNVPGPNDDTKTKFFRKAKWMIVNLLFPEFIFSKAICDLRLAIKELEGFPSDHATSFNPKSLQLEVTASEPHEHELRSPRIQMSIPGWKSAKLPILIRFLKKTKKFIKKPTVSSMPSTREEETRKFDDTNEKKQQWTLQHSYYSQMGGLRFRPSLTGNEYIFTASCLTSRGPRDQPVRGGPAEHPLTYLVLAKEDIQDKSKTDWVTKGIAILQVTRIILNVIVRHAIKLPITQMEIATIAFAVMAIFIYLVNWWKPQNVSRATTLLFKNYNEGPHDEVGARGQSLVHRILGSGTQNDWVEYRDRVPNDFVSLQGHIPFLYYFLGGSSLVFGGLHCLAWCTDFPTIVEMWCWRASSLVTAVLPVAALSFGIIAGSKADIEEIRGELKKAFPPDSVDQSSSMEWKVLSSRVSEFKLWAKDAQVAYVLQPKASRNWDEKPLPKIIGSLKQDTERWSRGERELEQFFQIHLRVMQFLGFLDYALSNENQRPWDLRESCRVASSNLEKALQHQAQGPPEFWRDFEEMVSAESRPIESGPVHPPFVESNPVNSTCDSGTLPLPSYKQAGQSITCAERLVDAYHDASNNFPPLKPWRKMWMQTYHVVTIFTIIIYTTARLIVIVLLFTTLRKVPVGVYDNTTWTRFIPNVS